MKRRDFLTTNSIASVGMLTGFSMAKKNGFESVQSDKHAYKLHYAPHFGMFKNHAGDDLGAQLDFMADQGFTAFEDNEMKQRSIATQNMIGKKLVDYKMHMGVFVAHTIYWDKPSLASGDENAREQFLTEIKESVEVAKRCNAKWMTVVPGHIDPKQDFDYQTAHVMESLKRASQILEPHGLVIVLEPLNFRDHPGLFLTKVSQAYALCKGVGSPSCKILNDLYHQQITEGNLIPNIDLAWEEIAYFQVGDNPGRKEPTSGEINYLNVFKHIHSKGFEGIVGMEHGNLNKGKAGELDLINAYKAVDNFQ